MNKYNLTFWQKIELFFMKIVWLSEQPENRKTWHDVKKGMEKHKHNYTIPILRNGFKWYKCEHEGCNYITFPSDRVELLKKFDEKKLTPAVTEIN